jgi:hypothetical protein
MKSVRSLIALTVSVVALAANTAAVHAEDSKPTPTAAKPVAAPAPAARLDRATQARIVEKIGAVLDEYYVYPEKVAKMKDHLHQRLKSGAYDQFTQGQTFAHMLTSDLVEVTGDRHLGIQYDPSGKVGRGEDEMTVEERARRDAEMRRFGDERNWGFKRVEVLPGNVGYMDLRFFGHPDWAGETVATAMSLLSKTDALIIDLRGNGGGYPQTVALLLSYLIAPESIHGGTDTVPLFTQSNRKEKTVSEIRTQPYVPGKRYLNRPVYVLTSHRSFSGAELFADAIKTHKRGALVGETTGGGSHSMLTRPLDNHFEMGVSFGWTRDAKTGFDWEKVGITPDVAVPQQAALEQAHLLALQKKQAGVTVAAADPREKQMLAMAVREAEQALKSALPKPPLEGNTTFRLRGHADAKAVYLAGDFNGWDSKALAMVKDGDGWLARIDLKPGKYFYKLVVDGQWIMDPDNKEYGKDQGGFDSSLCTVTK